MSIYTKLLEIQAMHLAFEKDASNPFFKAKYVSLDSIVEKLTPILDSKKLLVFHYTDNKEIVTTLLDTESTDETQETRCIDSKFPLIDSNDPQKLGSCITYAKRYNLGQIFNIITDRDDDGNEASGKVEKPKTKETVDTPSGWTKPKALSSPDGHCPECWKLNITKTGTTKDGRDYEMWTCDDCDIRYFVNRK